MKTVNIQKDNKIEAVPVSFDALLLRELYFSFEAKRVGLKNFSNILIKVPQHINIAICCTDCKCQCFSPVLTFK